MAMRGGAAAGQIDLLTVLAHELGHLIGFGHNSEPGHLMSETLAPGKRLLRMALPLVLHEFMAAVALQPSANRECSRSW